jgi:hypothetical protein
MPKNKMEKNQSGTVHHLQAFFWFFNHDIKDDFDFWQWSYAGSHNSMYATYMSSYEKI